jgi:hypothetical protein
MQDILETKAVSGPQHLIGLINHTASDVQSIKRSNFKMINLIYLCGMHMVLVHDIAVRYVYV